MTHTSTEQPEALRLAEYCDNFGRLSPIAKELRRLHSEVAAIQSQSELNEQLYKAALQKICELEASQAQRVPPKKLPQVFIDKLAAQHGLDFLTYTPFARAVEKAAHGITPEKQG